MHGFEHYGIILTADIVGIGFSQVFSKQQDELRYSLDDQ